MKTKPVLVVGGNGFVGRHLLNHLARIGVQSRVPVRHPHRCRDLRLIPGCETWPIAGWAESDLVEAMQGCAAVVNLAGILNEGGGRTFEQTHVMLPETLARSALAAGVPRLLHMSALGADAESGASDYLRSKGRGERCVLAMHGPTLAVTCFRPSVIFGPNDHFFNRFAALLRWAPGFLPLACAETRFAPVYVGDLVEAMAYCLDDASTHGKVYELCGPRVLALRDLVAYTARSMGCRVRLMPTSDRLARLQASILGKLPGKVFTLDHYRSLQRDSLCRSNGLSELGIQATDIETVVPTYLR